MSLPNFNKIGKCIAEFLMTQQNVTGPFSGKGEEGDSILSGFRVECIELYRIWNRYRFIS